MSEEVEPKERQSKRQKVLKEQKLPAEKDAILKSGQSTGTKIKHHAQDLYFGKQYHKLDNVRKDSISNGFNSILDLTNNSRERNGQRSLFTNEEWLKLSSKWNKQQENIEIIDLAMDSSDDDYCCKSVIDAFTLRGSSYMELDEIECFRDEENTVDLVDEFDDEKKWLSIWLASSLQKNNRDDKFYRDHRKTLREGKTVADQFYRFPGLTSREKKNIAGCCIQIAAVEGQVMNVKMVDQGLYVASHLGSLRLPSSQVEMRETRILLERLFTLKRNLLYLKNLFQKLEFDKSSESKSMERKLDIKRSPYENSSNEQSSSNESSNEEFSEEEISEEEASEEKVPRKDFSGVHKDAKYTDWVRGSWFPPPPKEDLRYDCVWHKHLFSLLVRQSSIHMFNPSLKH